MTTATIETLRQQLDATREQLRASEQALAERQTEEDRALGLDALGELERVELDAARAAVTEARERSRAQAAAVALLEARLATAEAEQRAARTAELRSAAQAESQRQQGALEGLSEALDDLAAAVEGFDAAGGELGAIRERLTADDPQRAAILEDDYRNALDREEARYEERLSDLRRELPRLRGAARSESRAPSEHTLPAALLASDGSEIAPAGVSGEQALALIDRFETESVQRIERDREAAIVSAFDTYAAAVQAAGFGSVPMPDRKLRDAAAGHADLIARLVSEPMRKALASLAPYIPAGPTQGISVRKITYDPFEIGREQERLDRGRAAVRALTS